MLRKTLYALGEAFRSTLSSLCRRSFYRRESNGRGQLPTHDRCRSGGVPIADD